MSAAPEIRITTTGHSGECQECGGIGHGGPLALVRERHYGPDARIPTIEHATCPACGAEDETRHRPTCRHAPPHVWTLRPFMAGGNMGGDLDHRGRAVIPGKWYLARVYDDTEEIVAGPWTDETRARRVAELVTSPRATVVVHPWHGFSYYSPELWWSPRDGVTTLRERWVYIDETWSDLALSTFIPGFAAMNQVARWHALLGVTPRHPGEFIQRGRRGEYH